MCSHMLITSAFLNWHPIAFKNGFLQIPYTVSVLVICKRSGLTEKMESIDRNSLTSYHSIHSLGHINVNITKLGKLYRVLDHLLYLTTKVQYGRTISSRDFGKSRSEFRLKVCYSPTMWPCKNYLLFLNFSIFC